MLGEVGGWFGSVRSLPGFSFAKDRKRNGGAAGTSAERSTPSPPVRTPVPQTERMSEHVVRVENLRKTYRGGLEALRGVSFDIHRGETFALLGPNGAGKSTVIEILEGYRDRTSGDVSVLGVDPHRGGLDWKARLGIVLQNTGEAPTATVRELLAHFASFYPRPRDVDEVIAAVGLSEKAKVSVRKLSARGGARDLPLDPQGLLRRLCRPGGAGARGAGRAARETQSAGRIACSRRLCTRTAFLGGGEGCRGPGVGGRG